MAQHCSGVAKLLYPWIQLRSYHSSWWGQLKFMIKQCSVSYSIALTLLTEVWVWSWSFVEMVVKTSSPPIQIMQKVRRRVAVIVDSLCYSMDALFWWRARCRSVLCFRPRKRSLWAQHNVEFSSDRHVDVRCFYFRELKEQNWLVLIWLVQRKIALISLAKIWGSHFFAVLWGGECGHWR